MTGTEELKVALVGLGCPKNQVDAETMLGLLQAAGCQLTSNPEEADAIVVNTCGFIADAREESVSALREAVRLKREGKARCVLATGCLAQRYPRELKTEIPELDGLVGVGQQPSIVDALRRALAGETVEAVGAPRALLPEGLPRTLSTPPWSAYLKLSDGCDRPCAFCAIPAIRGPMASRPMEAVVAEARRLAESGVRELNLIAQDTTRYGVDRYGECRLVPLLRELCQIDGIRWIRPLYYFPTAISDALIELTATEPRMCRYMDIPLQHVSPRVLRRMRRPGDGDAYLALVERIRAACPDVALRSTFIVGHPGESDADFRQLVDFLRAARLDRVGVFVFSPEEGTEAAGLPDPVHPEVARARYHRLMRVQRHVSLQRNLQWVGRRLQVLVEGSAPGEPEVQVGRSHRDAPEIDGVVYVRGGAARPGEFVEVTVTAAKPYDLYGVAAPR
ncbi:MAG: 30S ribosomal protein S12 methylthiotransferase RimO [Armatimonadota bacterium]|nr:30S ribosomal protein S12 methylthiotransferase RimO [Armatimonadota bacterium]